MTAESTLQRLDEHLEASEPDSMEWADGLGATRAAELLAALADEEWAGIAGLSAQRSADWRRLLAEVLEPGSGEQAQELLLALSADADEEVAFAALTKIAFHCGVNAKAEGAFVDAGILDEAFWARCRAHEGLVARAERAAQGCSEHWAGVLRLLASRL